MPHATVARFIEHATQLSRQESEPCRCVASLAPFMMELLAHAGNVLQARHYSERPFHYARNEQRPPV